jgi:16S rRNA (guanine(966)-N(2))-methyltransferase RsmD
MRIIAGKFKGKILKDFNLSTTRPTTDLVREALFDKIGLMINGKNFLDLFAGTGATGIEALSRGAEFCYFADNNANAIKLIKNNLSLINAQNFAVFKQDFLATLSNLNKQNTKLDFVFLDPPYASNFAEKAIEFLQKKQMINQCGMIIWEHDISKLDYIEKNFLNSTTKKYGKKYLTYIA